MEKGNSPSKSHTAHLDSDLIGLEVSKETGNIVRLFEKKRGLDLIKGDLKAPSIAFVVNDKYLIPDREHGFALSNVSFEEDDESGRLAVNLKDKSGLWEVEQIFKIRRERSLIERAAVIRYSGEEKQKLQAAAFILPSVGFGEAQNWSYQILGLFPPERVRFDRLSSDREVGDAATSVIVHHSSPDWSLLSFFHSETEEKSLQVKERKGAVELINIMSVQARLDQKREVSLGSQYLYYAPGDFKKGLKSFRDLYDLIGLRYPQDAADWARRALIFQSHPGGCMETECKDIGGSVYFKEHYLPHVRKLGFNAIYFLPVMQAHGGPYVGWDFYKVDERVGKEEDLKSLVKKAHEMGLRVMYDIVPIGRSFDYPDLDRFERWMCRDEQGEPVKSWGVLRALDYTNEEYQQFIAKVAEHYVREHGIDGYRVDSAFGDSPNWDPSRTERPTASSHGGIALMSGMRRAIKQVKPDTVLLPEAFNKTEFFAVSEFIYDYFLFLIFSKFFDYTPAEWCGHLRKWLELQKYSAPKGAVWMRFVSNHDTFRAADYFGIGLARALNALCTVIDGNLLFYMIEEVGSQDFYQRLFAIRRALPELNYGTCSYDGVECDRKEVFTCLRHYGNTCSVAAVNLAPEKLQGRIRFVLPEALLKEKSDLAVIDSWNGKLFALVSKESLADGKVDIETDLEGHECRIFTVRPFAHPQRIGDLIQEMGLLG